MRNKDSMKGIKIYDLENKLLQFADDTTVVLPDLNTANTLFSLLEEFEKASGFKLNVKKTKAMWQSDNRQNLNDRLLYLLLKHSEHYQPYTLNSKVKIWGSLSKVQEQTHSCKVNISSQIYSTLRRINPEKICCGVYDSNLHLKNGCNRKLNHQTHHN